MKIISKKNFFYVLKRIDIVVYFLIGMYFFYKFTTYKNFFYLYVNEWAFSETLIDYSGGFVRRGFIGFLFSKLAIPVANFPFASFVFYLISYVHLSYYFLKKLSHFPLLFRTVCFFSPFGIFYFYSNMNYFFGRRDLLILNFIILINSQIFKTDKNNLLLFSFLGTFIIFSYEILILFLPLFWKLLTVSNIKQEIFKKTLFILFSFANLLMLFKFSTPSDFNLLCKNISKKREIISLDNLGCWGAPSYLESGDKSIWIDEVINGLKYNNNFTFWILTFFLLLSFIYLLNHSDKWVLLYQIPLFFIFFAAQDYGRWFFLIFATNFICFNNNFEIKKNNKLFVISFLLIISGLTLDIPVYLFEEKIFLRF